VATVKGYAVTEFLQRVAKDFELVEVPDVVTGLNALVAGEVDAYVGSLLVTGYYLRREGISNVMAAGEIPFHIAVAMAARDDWPLLHSILNKAIAAIDAQEREALNRRWMGLQISRPPDYAMLWRLAMAGVTVLFLFLAWNWYLQRKTTAQKLILKQQNAALAAEVQERRRAEEEARAANELKSRLLANISHELRTPLNAIIGFSDLLHSQGAKSVSDDRKAEYLGHINSAGKHLLTLVNDALDLSAAEAGQITLDDRQVELGLLLDDVIPLVERRAGEAGVSILRSDPHESCTVLGDPRRLRQVVLNLVENSVKFTPAGGSVEVGHRRTADGEVRITIADTGLGMTSEQLKTAFKAFDRGSDPFVRASEGVGLGLALCEEIVRAHGGRIELQSSPGKGTKATIVLPAERSLADHRRAAG
jgi:signal transduction histidine kinase